jgi:hypothetical protein
VAKIGFGRRIAGPDFAWERELARPVDVFAEKPPGRVRAGLFLAVIATIGPTRLRNFAIVGPSAAPLRHASHNSPLAKKAGPMTGRRSAMIEAIRTSMRLGRCKDAVNDANSGDSTVEV